MTSMSPPGPATLSAEVESVLLALATESADHGLRLNDLAGATGLPTGHVGRHLRTLEANRLADFSVGLWRLTLRGDRLAGDLVAMTAPAIAV